MLTALIPIVAANLPAHPQQAGLGLRDLLVLIVVLIALGVFAYAIRRSRLNGRDAATPALPGAAASVPPPAAPPQSAPPQSADKRVPPELFAVIAAAVHTVIDQPHRILTIEGETGRQLQAWSVEGRRQIFSSHRIR